MQANQQPPILAEQARSGAPRGCGCLIVVALLIGTGIAGAPALRRALDDLARERVQVPEVEPPRPGLMPPEQACATARRAVRSTPHTRTDPPRDLSQFLMQDAPLPGFIDDERLVAAVDPAEWAAGLGDAQLWADAFERAGFKSGLRHFWATPGGVEMLSHQVLEFGSGAKALEFLDFMAAEVCDDVDRVDRSRTVPGAFQLLRRDPKGWTTEVVFTRGRLLVYVGFLSPNRVVRDQRVEELARRADELVRKS